MTDTTLVCYGYILHLLENLENQDFARTGQAEVQQICTCPLISIFTSYLYAGLGNKVTQMMFVSRIKSISYCTSHCKCLINSLMEGLKASSRS